MSVGITQFCLIADAIEMEAVMMITKLPSASEKEHHPPTYTEDSLFHVYCENLERVPLGGCFLTADVDFQILYANDAFYRVLGYDRASFASSYANRLSALTWDLPKSIPTRPGETVELEQKILRKGMDELWLRSTLQCLPCAERPMLYCISVDVTEEKRMRRDFEKLKGVTEHASALSGLGMFHLDCRTQTAVGFAGSRLFEALTPELQGVYGGFCEAVIATDMVYPEDAESLRETFYSVLRGRAGKCEVRIKRPGETIWLRMVLEPRVVDCGDECAFVAFHDITEYKQASLNYLQKALFLHAALGQKSAYAQLDITGDKVLRLGGNLSNFSQIIHEIALTELVKKHVAKLIYSSDRKTYFEFMDREHLLVSFQNGITSVQGMFRRIVDRNQLKWMTTTVQLFRDPLSQHVMALLTTEESSRSKSEEAAAIAERTAVPYREQQRENQAFDAMLSEESDMAYLVDLSTFQIVRGSVAFYNRLGLSEEECRGRKCYELMHHRDSQCPFCSPTNWSKERYYLWHNYNPILEQEFLMKNKIVSWQGRDTLLAIAVDLSNNQILNLTENDTAESDLLLGGIRQLISCANAEQMLKCAMETIGFFFKAQGVQFWEVQEQENVYLCMSEWKRNPEFLMDSRIHLVAGPVNKWLQSKKWLEPLFVAAPEEMIKDSLEIYNLVEESNIFNLYCYPMFDEDKLLGVITILNIRAHLKNTTFLDVYINFLVNEWRKHQRLAQLLYAGSHDSLTQLLSRAQFERFRSDYDADAVKAIGIAIVDINDMKGINTRRSMAIGDFFIQELANMLKAAFENDCIYRLDGDEFLVACTDDWDTFLAKNAELERLLSLDTLFAVSHGYAWDDVEKDVDVLQQKATREMRSQKARYYDSLSINTDLERRGMLRDLVNSIERGEFEVYLQPKFDLFTRCLCGAEALIRYRHPMRGLMLPGQFIGQLERNHFIRYIDLFVFEEVCRMLQMWSLQHHELPTISFNFSRQTLDEHDICQSVEKVYSQYDVPRGKLELEITESILDPGKNNLYLSVEQFHKSGFLISLDDFGTKYTNLSILSQLEFNMLKLDRSLIASIDSHRNNQIILKNVIAMCDEMEIPVIAEGIETEAQAALLVKLGCCFGQGYLFGRPMPFTDFETLFMLGTA